MNDNPKNTLNKPLKMPGTFAGWLVAAVGASFFISLLIVVVVDPRQRRLDWPLVGIGTAGGTIVFLGYVLVRWLCSWRNLVRFIFGAVCVTTAVALFYAEEDWRGRHAWRQFAQACQAKGEPLDLASAVPARVPDDQNFAMTPIVFTSYGALLTRDGQLIPSAQRDRNFAERMRMSPESSDSHAPAFDEYECSGHWAGGRFTKLEGWQNYYRRLAAQTNEFPVPAQPGSPAGDVLLALSKYDGPIAELRAASQLPAARYPVNYDSESPWEIYLPHLAPLKTCAQTLRLRSVAELQDSQPQQALDDVCLGLQLSDKVRNEPILISHLVRIAMVQLMLQPVWEGLAQHRWSEAQLVTLDAELATVDFFPGYRLALHGELGGQSGEMALIRRRPQRIFDLMNMTDRNGNNTGASALNEVTIHVIPDGWLYQSELRSERLVMDDYLPAADASSRTFSPDLVRRGDAAVVADSQAPGMLNWYVRIMLQGLGKVATKFAYGQTAVNLARTAVALERYRLAHGEYPETLDPLAPRFIPSVPLDVIGGQPLKYHRQTDGRFLLYSIGWNETDDGGKIVVEKGSTPGLDLAQGDWVWAYPAE
jgi:hypothetical protein